MSVGRRGFPLVVAAPSGAGKTSIARALVARVEDLVFSVSATTRAARPGEREGVDYLFVGEADFDSLLESGDLLEWAVVHGRRYGTPRAAVARAIAAGAVVVLDIDVQGARQVRSAFADAVLVFVLPPSADALVRRLAGRASEGRDELRRRLLNAKAELAEANAFDYVVVNDELERAVDSVQAIVRAERLRRARNGDLQARLARVAEGIDEFLERRG